MGQPTQDTNSEAAVFRKVDAERKKAAAQAELVQHQIIINALASTQPKTDIKDAVWQMATDSGVITLPKGTDPVKYMTEVEGNRPAVNDPRKDKPVLDALTEAQVKKQAEDTEKWATQFLEEEK
jgi:hypothetical protein